MFEAVTGPIIVASWFNAPLLAMETFGALTYFERFWSTDPWSYKLTMIAAILVDVATCVTVMAATWMYSIAHWGDAAYAASQPWVIPTYVVLCGLSALFCQAILSHRIYRLSNNWLYLPLLATPALLSLAGCCATAAKAATLDLSGRNKLTKLVIIWLSAKAACDMMIAAAQILNLRKIKSEFVESKNLVRRLSLQAVETGSITAFLAISSIVLYSLLPETNYSVLITMSLGRIYSITLLVNLNRRNYAGKDESTSQDKSRSGRRVAFADHNYNSSKGGNDFGLKSAARFDPADEEFDPIEPTVVYRTGSSREKTSEEVDWNTAGPGSEIELARSPLGHY